MTCPLDPHELPDKASTRGFDISFGDDDPTNIEEIVSSKSSNSHSPDAWYDLSGRKLPGKPTAKGIYINGGRKFVIK